MHDVVVVGAGHNGLVTAAYLARAGLGVLVLERRHIVGGAAATEELFPGVNVSTCSYIAYNVQDRVVRDLNLYAHGYRVRHVDPGVFSAFPDGRSLVTWSDVERSQASIRAFSDADADRYPDWLAFWSRASGLFSRYALVTPPSIDQLRRDVSGTEDEAVLARILEDTPADLLDGFFETDQIKAAMTVCADTVDLDAPGTLASWAADFVGTHANPEHQGLPIGGMGGLSESIARAARSFGAHIRLGVEVDRIVVDDNGHATGVELVDGQYVQARAVVSNADPRRTFLDLVGRDALDASTTAEIDQLTVESACLKLHAVVDQLPDFSRFLGRDADPRMLAHVRICPSLAYYRESLADARSGVPTQSPILHVQIPTVYDGSLAPAGTHIVSMWVRFEPTKLKEGSWDAVRRREGERAIDLLTEYAPNFRRSLKDWLVYTPEDLERRIYLTNGNIHHTDHALGQMLGDRLFKDGGHRTPLARLFMCGSGTHPGGTVSGASGYNAARVILEDLNLPVNT